MLLLRPLQYAWGNHLKEYNQSPKVLLRDATVAMLLLFFVFMIYFGMRWILFQLAVEADGFSIAPVSVLAFFINMIIPLVFLSSLSAHFSNFYSSEDLELLLSSPMSKGRLFLERSIITSIESSWMVLISVTPFLLSFFSVYPATISVVIALPISVIVLMLLPAFFSSLIGLVWNIFVSKIPRAVVTGALFASVAYLCFQGLSLLAKYLSGDNSLDADTILTVIQWISSYGELWSPSIWIASLIAACFNETGATFWVLPSFDSTFYPLVLMLSALGMLISAGLLFFDLFYISALSSVWGRTKNAFSFTGEQRLFETLIAKTFPTSRQVMSLIKRECILFFRDTGIMIQVVFLVFMLSAYLYLLGFQQNLRLLFTNTSNVDWEFIVIMANLTIETFLTVAMTSRLVFPSLSWEGRSIWILRTGPVSLKSIILAKFIFWITPITLALSCLGGISYFLVYGDVSGAWLKASMIAVVVLSIGSLAMYLGAIFSNFSWESRSQLIASFGSIVFMVSGISLGFINIAASFALLSSYRVIDFPGNQLLVMMSSFFILNIVFSMFFLKQAVRSLRKRFLEVH